MSDRPAFPSHPARPGPARGLRAAILPILLVLASALPAAAQVVPGSALHRERMALPPDAVFEATLQDVSRADAAAEVLGRARLDPAGQSPFRFEIPYDAARIVAGRRYVVRAEIRHEGRLLFTTDVAHPVLGAGAGQMDRVASCRNAVEKSGARVREGAVVSVAASDAFFPFDDGPRLLVEAGVRCIVHPGGSKRDEDTFKLCNEKGVTCLVTGVRRFRH